MEYWEMCEEDAFYYENCLKCIYLNNCKNQCKHYPESVN